MITSRSVRRVLLLSLLGFAPIACGPNKPAVTAGGNGGGPGVHYAGTMQCVDAGTTTTAPLKLEAVERCIYSASTKRLELAFLRAGEAARDHLNAKINGFTGKGTFASSPEENETTTFAKMQGYNDTPDKEGVHSTPGGTSAGAPECRGACTFTITDAGVTGAAAGAKGSLSGSVDCTSLSGAGVDCVKCTVSPSTINFDIKECERSD